MRNALLHYSPLTCKGYGPDILEDVPTQDLIDASIGLTPGDAICLKRSAQEWWMDESKKWPHIHHILHSQPSTPMLQTTGPFNDDAATFQFDEQSDAVPEEDRSVSYHTNWPDRGGKRWWAGPLLHGHTRPDDEHTEYFNEAWQEWMGIPCSFTAPTQPGEQLHPDDEF